MYARSTMLLSDPSRTEVGIAFVRDEVWPMVRGMEGCLGLSMLVDRESGRSITTTSWESQEALRTSRDLVRDVRAEAARVTGATEDPVVDEWEVASMHRAQHAAAGTCVRVAWSTVPRGSVEGALGYYFDYLLPHVERFDGFVSASLLVDRDTGRSVLSVAYDSPVAMARTRDQADYLRARSTQEANVEFLDVGEFDLALAHLHLPELV